MNRRESLKAIGLTAISSAVLLEACKPGVPATENTTEGKAAAQPGREAFEVERDRALNAAKFFDAHEMATIAILSDIIIPKDEKSGSATDAKVPEFIEFIVKDMPEHQTPMRGGLKWLDIQCLNRFQQTFKDASEKQRIEMVEDIAYPKKVKPGMEQGAAFFSLMRNLTASGFFTTEMGVKDLGYVGNVPNKWTGVPADVLKQYGMENV
ncbi:transcriptional initiation protein Tat [Pedobacter lusitanus]|uniref:Transcriptional initiation protein Tat n=1 Tax=Pedobacter lusitanus TaxID=1503925 RepID=A0A0D0FVH7_9SPHI|nr:gluconate 2-dehydrogenase subunit 3 family protein [Pedobacter lusitanus]KIO76444.1 transcriptional initiation protein Tat [Pedobacter lusitanus]